MNTIQKRLEGLREKWNWINEGREGHEKGKASEERFHTMVLSLMDKKLPWLALVKKANALDDCIGKVDFKLDAFAENESGKKYFKIRVQIKSSLFGAQKFKEKYPRSKAHVIIMDEQMNAEQLSSQLDLIYLKEIYKRYHPALLSS